MSSNPAWAIILFFSKNDFFQEVLWLSAKFSEVQILENENLWLKLHFVFRCASRLLAASPRNFYYFYLIKMKNHPLPSLILDFFWPAELIKTLFTYFNHKIKPKPSLDGTLSPNSISFYEGLYCTVLAKQDPLPFPFEYHRPCFLFINLQKFYIVARIPMFCRHFCW